MGMLKVTVNRPVKLSFNDLKIITLADARTHYHHTDRLGVYRARLLIDKIRHSGDS